ncbi:hypothetical protein K439DRAFT_1114633 [Ramaria rubella]|nr:hypothetical protein K439DRAFT_1114633 [Ramaria rubella]
MLLRDHQREDARKARVETKRKINSSEILGSEATSDRSSSVLQTPRSGRHASQAENNKGGESDASSENALMSAKAQAQLLGKESAQAVKRILDGDRKRKVVEETKEITAVTFWREGTGLVENVLPQLVTDQSNPFLVVLGDMLNSNNYVVASSLIDSGALTTVPLSTQLHEWLFSTAMSTVNESISNSAYRVLLVLHRESYSTDIVARAQLSQRMILTPLFKHGVNTKIVQLLKIGEETGSVFGSSQEMKVERACRFVIMLEALGRSQNIALEAIPTVISVLLLLSLEPATNSSLCQDALSAIEAILSSSIMTRAIELDTRLLRLLQGCSSSSGRVRRWVAWAMLGGDLQSTHGCGDVPPIDLIVNMFSTDSPGDIKLIVTPDTDYVLLSAIVDILSVAMSDVDAYVRSTGGLASTNTICEALERLNGKIVDTRAAHMDRTQAKGAIDRLHKRLVYQRHAVKEMLQTKTGKLDQFFLPKRKA